MQMESTPRAGRLRIATLSFGAALALAAASAGLHASHSNAAGATERPRPTGRAIVLVDHHSAAAVDRVADRNNLNVKSETPEIGAIAVKPPAGVSVAELHDQLIDRPGVAAVAPEYFRQVRYSPNDPGFASSDGKSPNGVRQWNLIKENFRGAWRRSRGKGLKLAVLDTGIDRNHRELKGRIVRAVDQSGTGVNDTFGHGTHVAGLACAEGNNHYGIAGAAFRCSLIVEKVGEGPDLTDDAIAAGITDATVHGAKVISMSFGGGGDAPGIKTAIDYAWKHGVLMVAAASNDPVTDQGYPAQYLQPTGTSSSLGSGHGLVVTDAAYGGANADAGYGSGVSMAAYGAAYVSPQSGKGIFSTFPHGSAAIDTGYSCGVFCTVPPCNCRATYQGDSGYAYLEGTSMATPQVAGAAALIRQLRPRLSPRKVMTILKQRASGNYSTSLGWGILNAGQAVAYARNHYRR